MKTTTLKNRQIILNVIFACFILIANWGFSQDTIYKRNSTEIIVAKIIEININEIKYKRFEMPEGPLFVIAKNDIEKVKYQEGSTENFEFKTTEIPNNSNSLKSNLKNELIEKFDTKGRYLYNGQKINDRVAFKVIENANFGKNNQEINSLISKSKQQKKYQYISGFSAVPLGYATLVGLMYSSNFYNISGSGNNDVATGATVLGVLLTAGSQVLSHHFKKVRISYADKATEMYNKNILNP